RARFSSSTFRRSSSSAFARSLPSSCARPPDAFLRLVFAGTPQFAERALAALVDAGHEIVLVLTQPDRPGGRGLRPAPSAVKRLAESRGVALFPPASWMAAADRARILAAGADAMVVAAYGLLLPKALLDIGRFGALNIHASLL